MEELPPEPQNLRFLRRLVTALTVIMILGISCIVVLLFLRLANPARTTGPTVPGDIMLPEGVTARAVTFGEGWYAIVTDGNTLLIYDAATGELRQSVAITR